jgi:enamine deaminase RidA (YjgF/YER057c/UK114 family)
MLEAKAGSRQVWSGRLVSSCLPADKLLRVQVYRIASYHVGFDAEEVLGPMIGALKQYMPNHQPIWTAIGVEKLAFPEMKVEIEVSAHVPSGNGNS